MTIHFSLSAHLLETSKTSLHLLPIAKFSAHVTEHMTASISMRLFSPVGALDDFAISDYGTPDAIRSRVVNYSSQLNTTWVRPYTVVNQPVDYPQSLDPINSLNSTYFWKQSRYAAAGMKWTGVPLTGAEYLDKVQYEPLSGVINILTFEAATLEGDISPYRGVTTGNSTAFRSTDRAYSGVHSLKVTSVAANTATYYRGVPTAGMAPAPSNLTNNIAAQARVSTDVSGTFSVNLHLYDATFTEINVLSTGGFVHPGDGSWQTFYIQPQSFSAGIVWMSMDVSRTNVNGAGSVYYVDDHRILSAQVSGPTPYTPARKIILNIQADRINRVRNGSFIGSARGWQTFGSAAPALVFDPTTGLSSQNSAKVTVPYYTGAIVGQPWYGIQSTVTSDGVNNANITSLVPGIDYVASTWVKRNQGCPNVYLNIGRDSDVLTGGDYNTIYNSAINNPNYVQGAWVRVWTTFRVLEGSTGEVRMMTFIKDSEQNSGVNSIFWATDVLVEEGTIPGNFFDGSFGGFDYLWEGSAGWSRSHYYQDRRQKSYRLNDIVTQALPVGSQFEIRYASFVERPPQTPSGTPGTNLGGRIGPGGIGDTNVTQFVKNNY